MLVCLTQSKGAQDPAETQSCLVWEGWGQDVHNQQNISCWPVHQSISEYTHIWNTYGAVWTEYIMKCKGMSAGWWITVHRHAIKYFCILGWNTCILVYTSIEIYTSLYRYILVYTSTYKDDFSIYQYLPGTCQYGKPGNLTRGISRGHIHWDRDFATGTFHCDFVTEAAKAYPCLFRDIRTYPVIYSDETSIFWYIYVYTSISWYIRVYTRIHQAHYAMSIYTFWQKFIPRYTIA